MSCMCHTMTVGGYPWRLFHFEEKVKCCKECVCSLKLFQVLCHTKHALYARTACGRVRMFGGRVAGCTLYWHVRTHTVLMCVLHFACVGVHEYSFTLPLV